MKTLVFDTETTGLPPRGAPPSNTAAWDKCRIVQIAWNVYDSRTHDLERSVCFMVKPEGFVIPAESTAIHGITTERAVDEGVPIADVLEYLRRDLCRVATLVAHNIRFDDNVVMAEMHRIPSFTDVITAWQDKERKCTMLMGTPPKGRWPKLVTLYERLFGAVPECTLHRADADVEVCAKCFFALTSPSAPTV
jgi:DNA polymerase III epsilon subunit-like protein